MSARREAIQSSSREFLKRSTVLEFSEEL